MYCYTVNLNKFSSNTIFRGYTFGKFYSVKYNILVEDLIRWKRGFEIFLIEHYAGDIGNISPISIIQFLFNQCHSPYNRRVRSHRVLYLQFFGLYDIYIIYLHAIEACLKAIIAIFYLVLGQLPRGKLPPGQFPPGQFSQG